MSSSGTGQLTEACCVDHAHSGSVHLSRTRARTCCAHAVLLCRRDHLIDLCVLGRRAAKEDLLGDIRKIAVESSGDIDQYGLPVAKLRLIRTMVADRGISTCLDQNEVDRLGTVGPQDVLDLTLQFEFRHTRPRLL